MLAVLPSLLAFLALTNFAQARTYVASAPGVLANSWASEVSPFVYSETDSVEACSSATDDVAGAVGFFFGNGDCYSFTSYPSVCDGFETFFDGYQQAMVDRCSSGPAGYVQADDSTCIYTGGVALTTTSYSANCANGAPVSPAPSPAPYKKRQNIQQAAFIGGKTCPIGEMACPLAKGFGCVNVKENLNSCGGCIGGAGVDCSDIIGADEVACDLGSCVVQSCTRGFSLSSAGQCLKR